jgi:hypothetical protein
MADKAADHPSIADPVPTITLEEVVRVLTPRFKGDIYLIAEHVRALVTRGDPNGVPAFNAGCGRIHPACFVNGMVAVVGRYDPYNGQPILEIAGLKGVNSWDWSPTANTLGRKEFEKHLLAAVRTTERSSTPASAEASTGGSEKPPTSRQKVIVAIVQQRYPNGIPATVTIAALTQLVAKRWESECLRQEVDAGEPPNRDTVKRTLQQAGLLP